MYVFRIAFLVAVLTVTSGYAFRCYMFCIDQTSIQANYVEQRDRCREYAQLKADMAMREAGGAMDDKAKKAQLVSLFSQCMGNNGWSVPDGKPATPAAAPAAAAVATAAAPNPLLTPAPVPKPEDIKPAVSRASECAFARQAASASAKSAARARACDIECADRLRAEPEAPRPAACAPETSPRLSKGFEKE